MEAPLSQEQVTKPSGFGTYSQRQEAPSVALLELKESLEVETRAFSQAPMILDEMSLLNVI